MKKIRLIAALLALLLFLASCSDRNAFRVGEAICTVNGKGYVSLQSAVDAITGTSSRGLDDSVYIIELIRNVDGEILDENKEGVVIPSSFTGNINNFNVIYLLNQGKPQSMGLAAKAGYTDLLVTWLYKMTVNDTNYKMAAVIGIMVFVVTAVISLIVYGLLPSVKDEEVFQ